MTPDEVSKKLGVSRETKLKLYNYLFILRKWQKSINLVASSTLENAWQRHILDCGQLAHYLPSQTTKILDVDAQTLEKYEKYLKYAGMGISSAMPENSKFPFGRSKYYYSITKREFEKKLGINKTNIKTYTITSLHKEIRKKYKFAPSKKN